MKFTQKSVLKSVLCGLVLSSLGACAPLMVGSMVGAATVAADRRTSGTQLEDETIEFKSNNQVKYVLGDRGHVNVTSFNRSVLLTGEVPSAEYKAKVEAAVAKVENVKGVLNELAVLGNSSYTQRTSDSIITGKVKAAFVDAKDLTTNAFKVVTERGVVYLMGRVTNREIKRATEVARTVSGVEKVIRSFEVISEDELKSMQTKPAVSSLKTND